MSSSSFVLNDWVEELSKTGKLTEEEKKAVLGALGKPEATEFIKGAVLRQADYSKSMNKLKEEEARLKADFDKKQKAEDDFHNSLSTWKTGSEKKLKDATEAREAAEARLAKIRERIEKAETDVIEKDELAELLKGVEVNTNRSTEPPNRTRTDDDKPDPRYLTADDFKREALHYSKLPALINKLDREYHKLYGDNAQEIDWDKVIDQAVENKRSIKDEVEVQFKLSDKRKELETADIDKRIKDAEERGATRARSELAASNPGATSRRPDQQGSPIFEIAKKQADGKTLDQNAGGDKRRVDAVSAAVASFNDGKYRKTA